MKLIIFDLDQTLVDFLSVHDQATMELFQKFFHTDASIKEIDYAGNSLIENFTRLAALKGIAADKIKNRAHELLGYYEEVFGKLLTQQSDKGILPGAKTLLNKLSKTDNFIVLYTGDSEGIVKHVFRVTGLGKFFRFAIYGNDAETRHGLIKLAIEKAQRVTSREFRGRDVIVIGDSIRDIDAGKKLNTMTISVATGFHSVAELKKHHPDYIFKSLKDYAQIINLVAPANPELPDKKQQQKAIGNRYIDHLANACLRCSLKGSKPVLGEGPEHAAIMLIGQNPGQEEDKQGRPFVGRSGKYLDIVIRKSGLNREALFITSVVKCRTVQNRKPTKAEIQSCLPLLVKQIKQIRPRLIVLMGNVAWQTPRLDGVRYLETYHPAAAMRFPRIREKFEQDFKHIKDAL